MDKKQYELNKGLAQMLKGGVILPGGESTVQGQLLDKLDMKETLKTMISDGLPVLATCAGLILLAEHIGEKEAAHLGTMPVTVQRNAYGRQLSSFMTTAAIKEIGDYPMVFIRAPYITDIHNNHVEILSVVDGHIVAAQYENQIGLAFHPEMTDDIRLHQRFINLVKSRKSCISELDFMP